MDHTPPFTDPDLRQGFLDCVTAVLRDLRRKDRPEIFGKRRSTQSAH